MSFFIRLMPLMHIFIALLVKGCEVVIPRRVPKFLNPVCAARALRAHDALYLHAASRSASTRDFPRVTRLRNRSVSRYDDIQDDWPIAVSVPLWKIDSYWRTNWPKLTRGRLRVARTSFAMQSQCFLSYNEYWPEVNN